MVRQERYGDASHVVWLLEAELDRRIGALVGAEVGGRKFDPVEEERESGCEMATEPNAPKCDVVAMLAVESREDERAMSKEVAGGEMLEYGEVKNGGRLYFDIL